MKTVINSETVKVSKIDTANVVRSTFAFESKCGTPINLTKKASTKTKVTTVKKERL